MPSTLLDVTTASTAAARGLVVEAARTAAAARRVLLGLDELLDSGLLDEVASSLREIAAQSPASAAAPARRSIIRPDPVTEPTLFG